MSAVRVFGIGNRWRRDDAAGPATAGIIREMRLPGVIVSGDGYGGSAMPDAWESSDIVFLVDAAVSGAPPGSIHRLDARDGRIPSDIFPCSTHDLGAAEITEFARALGRLPRRLVLYGIEGIDFGHGEGMTPEVAAACRTAAEEIRREIEGTARTEHGAADVPHEPEPHDHHQHSSSTERRSHA